MEGSGVRVQGSRRCNTLDFSGVCLSGEGVCAHHRAGEQLRVRVREPSRWRCRNIHCASRGKKVYPQRLALGVCGLGFEVPGFKVQVSRRCNTFNFCGVCFSGEGVCARHRPGEQLRVRVVRLEERRQRTLPPYFTSAFDPCRWPVAGEHPCLRTCSV